jgi:hypothetical protein
MNCYDPVKPPGADVSRSKRAEGAEGAGKRHNAGIAEKQRHAEGKLPRVTRASRGTARERADRKRLRH